MQFLNGGSLKITHQHTPWSHWRCAGLEGSWHNIAHCVNTSPPYILCKNCDWNTLHNCLFYILENTGEKKEKIKSFQSHIISGEVLFCSFHWLQIIILIHENLWLIHRIWNIDCDFGCKKSKWFSRERTRGTRILFPLRDLLLIKLHRIYLGEYFTSNTLLLKTYAPQALFFWKVGVNESSQCIASVGFSRVGLSTLQTH